MIIQNLACIPIVGDGSEKRVYLPHDFLENKKINSLFFFAAEEDFGIQSPFNNLSLTEISELDNYSIFLNLFDINNQSVLSDVSFDILSKNQYLPSSKYYPVRIDRKINFEKSYFSYKSELNNSVNLLLYCLYETHAYRPFTDLVSGSVSFELPDQAEIKLSDIVNNTLKNRKIKKISITNNQPYVNYKGYLNLELQNGEKIEYLPMALLADHSPNEIYLDNVLIDFENSQILNYNNAFQKTTITFTY